MGKEEKGQEELRKEIQVLSQERGLVNDKVKGGKSVTTKAVTEEGKTEKVSKIKEPVSPPANHINCSNCKKNVPKMNFDLHQVRCAAQLLKEQKDKAEVDYFNSLQSQADLESSKAKKNKKKKKPQTKENTVEDDFDSLCEQFQSLDKVCNFTRCKTLVSTLGVTCTFCRIR